MRSGLARLGLKRGDTMAIVGSNRPKLYWSVTAAQMLGRRSGAGLRRRGRRRSSPYVLAHADVRFAAVEDQEQVDKLLSIAERLPKLERIVYDERRGLRDYDHGRLRAHRRRHRGRSRARSRETTLGPVARSRNRRRARARTARSFSTPRAPRASRRASYCPPSAASTPPPTRSRSTSSPQRDEALAYLPLAWVGDHYLNYAQALVAGFCIACPESADTAMAGHEGDRPDLLLRAAARIRADAHRA